MQEETSAFLPPDIQLSESLSCIYSLSPVHTTHQKHQELATLSSDTDTHVSFFLFCHTITAPLLLFRHKQGLEYLYKNPNSANTNSQFFCTIFWHFLLL